MSKLQLHVPAWMYFTNIEANTRKYIPYDPKSRVILFIFLNFDAGYMSVFIP
jgi:hypothetical protein